MSYLLLLVSSFNHYYLFTDCMRSLVTMAVTKLKALSLRWLFSTRPSELASTPKVAAKHIRADMRLLIHRPPFLCFFELTIEKLLNWLLERKMR